VTANACMLQINAVILIYLFKKKTSTVFNIDNNNKCFLSKSAY